jgi:carbon monoxide dehydrogenase subunit G
LLRVPDAGTDPPGYRRAMVSVQRTFVVDQPLEVVVDYLKDFSRAQEWDPGTKSCRREDAEGPVQVGATWHNVSEFRGRETELDYRLEVLKADHLTFVGQNRTATSTDDLSFTTSGEGTAITYRAHVEFHGLAKLAGPFLQSEFERLGDQTEKQMTRVINDL